MSQDAIEYTLEESPDWRWWALTSSPAPVGRSAPVMSFRVQKVIETDMSILTKLEIEKLEKLKNWKC